MSSKYAKPVRWKHETNIVNDRRFDGNETNASWGRTNFCTGGYQFSWVSTYAERRIRQALIQNT
jgi:hypothetical protein